jgi:hypothetical protein
VAVVPLRTATGLPWRLWSHTLVTPAPGRYRIELSMDGGARTRRLDAGYYVREFEIPSA